MRDIGISTGESHPTGRLMTRVERKNPPPVRGWAEDGRVVKLLPANTSQQKTRLALAGWKFFFLKSVDEKDSKSSHPAKLQDGSKWGRTPSPSRERLRGQQRRATGLPLIRNQRLPLRGSAGLSPASPFSPAIRGIGHLCCRESNFECAGPLQKSAISYTHRRVSVKFPSERGLQPQKGISCSLQKIKPGSGLGLSNVPTFSESTEVLFRPSSRCMAVERPSPIL